MTDNGRLSKSLGEGAVGSEACGGNGVEISLSDTTEVEVLTIG